MRFILVLVFLSFKVQSFAPTSKELYSSKWSYVTEDVLSLKKRNPLYFRDKNIKDQLSFETWNKRLDDIEMGALNEISRKDYFNKKLIVGEIIASIGDVRLNREGGRIDGNAKFIYEGDIIETRISGSCWIALLDGTLFRLSPETSISISEVIFNASFFQSFVRVNKGEIFAINRSRVGENKNNGRFLDLIFLSVLEPELIEQALRYFDETLFSTKKIKFRDLLNYLKIYTNDFKFEDWKLKAGHIFYNENMLVNIESGSTHIFVDEFDSYIKVSGSGDKATKPKYTTVAYDGVSSDLDFGKWYRFKSGTPEENDYMNDKEFSIKMVTSNLSPFYFLRERFMNKYSYYINNSEIFPTIKNFSNYKGEKFQKRVDFVLDYFKKSETTFRKVKGSYVRNNAKKLKIMEYQKRYHRTNLRLITLRGLEVLSPDKIFQKNNLLYSGLMEYRERASNVINSLLKEAIYNEEKTEYLSRQ